MNNNNIHERTRSISLFFLEKTTRRLLLLFHYNPSNGGRTIVARGKSDVDDVRRKTNVYLLVNHHWYSNARESVCVHGQWPFETRQGTFFFVLVFPLARGNRSIEGAS